MEKVRFRELLHYRPERTLVFYPLDLFIMSYHDIERLDRAFGCGEAVPSRIIERLVWDARGFVVLPRCYTRLRKPSIVRKIL